MLGVAFVMRYRTGRRLPSGRTGVSAALLAALVAGAGGGCGDRLETGDLPQLSERGRLRILVPRLGEGTVLPRHGNPFDHERRLAARFAASVGLEPEWVRVDRHDELIPALVEGRGDLIAANLAVTDERRSRISFSDPVGYVREQVVTRSGDASVQGPDDLVGRRVTVRRSSSYWSTLETLRSEHPGVEVVAAPEELDTEDILYRVATGEYDVTVSDDDLAVEVLAYQPNLRAAFDLIDRRPIAWGLRREDWL